MNGYGFVDSILANILMWTEEKQKNTVVFVLFFALENMLNILELFCAPMHVWFFASTIHNKTLVTATAVCCVYIARQLHEQRNFFFLHSLVQLQHTKQSAV